MTLGPCQPGRRMMEFPWYLVPSSPPRGAGPWPPPRTFWLEKVSLIARGNDSPLVRNQTMRVNVANAKFLARHRAGVLGFLKAYKKSVDWAYSTPVALEAYAELSDQSVEFAKYIVKEFAFKESNQLDEIKGEDPRAGGSAGSKAHTPRFDPRGHRKGL